MGNFQRGGGGGFRGGSGGGRPPFQRGGFRGGDRGEVTMHKAVCNKCGNECQVPFRPTGQKPVYCDNCFKRNDERGGGDRGSDRGFSSRGPSSRGSYNDKPSFRQDFNRAPASAPSGDDNKKQFAEINQKLDRLINAIDRLADSNKATKAPAAASKMEKIEKVEEKKAPIKLAVKKKTESKIVKKKK